jgi:dienelactone hydrolase
MLSLFLSCLVALALASVPLAAAELSGNVIDAPGSALLHERVLTVPGDPEEPTMLQVTIYTPPGPGPFPLAVMNHGSTASMPPSEQPRYRHTFAAYYFLSRGYAVVLPMMRGYAGSGGKLRRGGCDDVRVGLEAAKDIRAVIDYMKHQPDIDGGRIVVAGQSFGGWNALALGALDVPNVKGIVSFAGGMKATDCAHPEQALIDAAPRLGAATRTPSIWFFGENDKVFATPLWRAMYEGYVSAGGHAELVDYGTFGTDSHNLLSSSEGLPLWVPQADAFLARLGLPHAALYPELMPTLAPPPSRYAETDDVNALPYSSDRYTAAYRKFLDAPLPRAIALGPHGVAFAAGGFDPIARALKSCADDGPDCRLYAVDNHVVWVRPTPAPPPSHFAALDDVNAVPYIDEAGRAAYRKFLQMRRPRAFAVAPDGGWDAASAGADPLAFALHVCNRSHRSCRLYAVDSDVVWQP